MDAKIFSNLLDDLATYYHYECPKGRALSAYLAPAHNVPNDKSDALFDKVTTECKYFPQITTWRELCAMFDTTKIPEENTVPCGACRNEGVVFYRKEKNGEVFAGYCPMCRKGISMSEIAKRKGMSPAFAPTKYAEAARLENEALKRRYPDTEVNKSIYNNLMERMKWQ